MTVYRTTLETKGLQRRGRIRQESVKRLIRSMIKLQVKEVKGRGRPRRRWNDYRGRLVKRTSEERKNLRGKYGKTLIRNRDPI